MRLLSKKEWEIYQSKIKNPHILQTYRWGELKSNFGWKPYRILIQEKPIQILFRKLPLNFTIAYLPKINLDIKNVEMWSEIDEFCKTKKSIFLKYEPDEFGDYNLQTHLPKMFEIGKSIQPQRTIVVDLNGSEDDWLNRMKSKTRYNIRLAKKKEIRIVQSDDIDTFYELMINTSERDNFGVHSKQYYQLAYTLFEENQNVALLLAYYKEEPLAGLMVFKSGERSWYFYGASNNKERNRMPTYLLQFEAMRWAKSHGCKMYDLWGIPDEDEDVLEAKFDKRSDGLWGVYRFKRGFGGEIIKSAPALDRIYNPLLYKAILWYQKIRGNLM